jgi:hypothetical protein
VPLLQPLLEKDLVPHAGSLSKRRWHTQVRKEPFLTFVPSKQKGVLTRLVMSRLWWSGCKIAVLGDLSWPHLTELRHLPPTAQIVASGTSLEDFAGKEAVLAQADVLLASPPCGRDLMTKLWHLCPQIKWVGTHLIERERRAPKARVGGV